MKHAKLSASGSSRWLNCPASVRMTANIPRTPSSVYANEGSIAHELAEKCLKSGHNAFHYVGQTFQLDNGYELSIESEMADYVQEYVDYVNDLAKEQGTILKVEETVKFDKWVPDGFGTSDAIIIDQLEKVIHIVDLKYGMGEKVFAEGNTQAQLYALGVFQSFPDVRFKKVCIHIHQPRINHVDCWEIDSIQLAEFGKHVKETAKLCLTDDAPFGPSDKACRWCPVSAKCTALAKHSLETISSEFDDLDAVIEAPTAILKDPELLTAEQISKLLPKLPTIEKWCKTIAEGALEEIQQGNSIPGYKAVEGRSNRNWTKAGQSAIADILGADAYAEPKILSPAQAEKILKKDKLSLEEDWVFKKPGKISLAPASDKRPPVSNVKDNFSKLD